MSTGNGVLVDETLRKLVGELDEGMLTTILVHVTFGTL